MGIQEETAPQGGGNWRLAAPASASVHPRREHHGNKKIAPIAALKGQMDAIEQVSLAKNSPITFQREVPAA